MHFMFDVLCQTQENLSSELQRRGTFINSDYHTLEGYEPGFLRTEFDDSAHISCLAAAVV